VKKEEEEESAENNSTYHSFLVLSVHKAPGVLFLDVKCIKTVGGPDALADMCD